MKHKFEVKGALTGFFVAMLIVSLIVVGFSLFMQGLQEEYQLSENVSISKYDYYGEINETLREVRGNVTDEGGDEGALDIIGSYVRQGIAAMKIAGSSFGLFESFVSDAGEDVPFLNPFMVIIGAIVILILIFVLVAALLKWGI